MTTTQTQVTGPVDDAIDAEVKALRSVSYAHGLRRDMRRNPEMDSLMKSISRRLARPTPDQIRAALDVTPEGKALNFGEVIRLLDRQTSAVVALFDAEVGS